MIIIIKIVLISILIYVLFQIIGELSIVFYKPATDTAVDTINEMGLDNYVRRTSINDCLRHIAYVFILISILTAAWHVTEGNINGNTTTKVEITNKKQ